MKRLVRRLKTTGPSITTNHKNPILNYESLGKPTGIHSGSMEFSEL
jgi:hypothetical protein